MGLFKQPEVSVKYTANCSDVAAVSTRNPAIGTRRPKPEKNERNAFAQNWVCRKKEMNISPMSEPDCKRSMLNVKVNVVDCALVTQPVSL